MVTLIIEEEKAIKLRDFLCKVNLDEGEDMVDIAGMICEMINKQTHG